MKKVIVLFMAGLFVTACTWVEISEEGKKIRIVSMDDVKTCKKIGKVSVSVKDKIAGFDRNEDKVKSELEKLARNTVIELKLKGDSIVPVSKIKDGKQIFAVYKCINPEATE